MYYDWGDGISLGTDGRAYVTGSTQSTDFPMENPYQAVHGGGFFDVFVSALSFNGKAPRWIYDYNGDGTSDIAVFRESSGLWAVRWITRIYFGGSSDQPVPADYSGNSVDDIAIFRAGSGLWAARSVTRVYFGTVNDIPVIR